MSTQAVEVKSASTTPVEPFDITKEALLLRVRTGCYYGLKTSKEFAAEIAKAHGMQQGTTTAGVYVLSQNKLNPVFRAYDALRTFVHSATIPWEDGGWRLLSARSYVKIYDAVTTLKAAYLAEVDKCILTPFDELKAEAKARLNGGYREEMFPTKDELKEKYYVDIRISALAATDDVRVKGLSSTNISEIKKNMEAYYAHQLQEAQKAIVDALIEAVGLFCERLKNEKAVLRKPSIDKLKKLCKALPALNISNDIVINVLIGQVEKLVSNIDVDNIRKDVVARAEQAKVTSSILDELKKFRG